MEERRAEARRLILSHFDKRRFEQSMMYGVKLSDMDRDELAAVF